MLSEAAIKMEGVHKKYNIYDKPIERLLQLLPWNREKKLGEEFWALRDVNLEIAHGEVIGIVGKNGAGKSTLLQLVCKTLQPSSGSVVINGKIAALLELGSGFNPEFSGRENVYMSGAIAGLERAEIDAKYDAIVAFADIGEFIDTPVKNYSSGMMVRLAFAVATSVEPDILVIDEALSVGDGAFARKSFDRIMQLKERGCTILFCSHALYQIEVLCKKVLWIDKGVVRAFGDPAGVVGMYQKYLDGVEEFGGDGVKSSANLSARIKNVRVFSDDGQEGDVKLVSEVSMLGVDVSFVSDVSLPTPSVAVVITDDGGRNITSCGTFYDGVELKLDGEGSGFAGVRFAKIALRRGRYYIHVLLMCENAVYIYESVQCASLEVVQRGSEVGIVALERSWSV